MMTLNDLRLCDGVTDVVQRFNPVPAVGDQAIKIYYCSEWNKIESDSHA